MWFRHRDEFVIEMSHKHKTVLVPNSTLCRLRFDVDQMASTPSDRQWRLAEACPLKSTVDDEPSQAVTNPSTLASPTSEIANCIVVLVIETRKKVSVSTVYYYTF